MRRPVTPHLPQLTVLNGVGSPTVPAAREPEAPRSRRAAAVRPGSATALIQGDLGGAEEVADASGVGLQVGLWNDAELPVGSSSADLEWVYREAVKVACDASALRRQLPALVMAAARAGARAQKQQAEVAKDLGISRAKVSRLYGVMALEARLADEGVELPAGVCESHLEALLPLDHQRRLELIDSMRERPRSVAWLRGEIATSEQTAVSLTPQLELVRRHLGHWLKRDWTRDTEGLMPAFEPLTRDVAMATAVRTTAPNDSSIRGGSDG